MPTGCVESNGTILVSSLSEPIWVTKKRINALIELRIQNKTGRRYKHDFILNGDAFIIVVNGFRFDISTYVFAICSFVCYYILARALCPSKAGTWLGPKQGLRRDPVWAPPD